MFPWFWKYETYNRTNQSSFIEEIKKVLVPFLVKEKQNTWAEADRNFHPWSFWHFHIYSTDFYRICSFCHLKDVLLVLTTNTLDLDESTSAVAIRTQVQAWSAAALPHTSWLWVWCQFEWTFSEKHYFLWVSSTVLSFKLVLCVSTAKESFLSPGELVRGCYQL